jgi:predicted nucleic acid-binding protein
VFSAIIRLGRQGELSGSRQRVAVQRLAHLRLSWREVLPTERVRELAQRQLEIYELRAGGALQLAAALVWCNQRPRQRTFVCQDQRLSAAASAAGFRLMVL